MYRAKGTERTCAAEGAEEEGGRTIGDVEEKKGIYARGRAVT